MADATLNVAVEADINNFSKNLGKANKDLDKFSDNTDKNLKDSGKNFNDFKNTVNTAIKAIAVGIVVDKLIDLGKQVLSVTAEFEKFKAVLSTTLGSSALADLKLQELQDFAAKTPFGVKELTDSFIKLANQGFKPTSDQLRKLGDLAASTGKSFDQLTEAVLDAQVGEFERLKEFGIRASVAGDKVTFTFKGISTTVDKTSESIREYITALGDAEGVSGSMDAVSKTLTGQISNLGDAWDQMLNSIGKNTHGVFASAISTITEGINKLTEFNNKLEIGSKFGIKGQTKELLQLLNPFSKLAGTSQFEAYTQGLLDLQKTLSQGNSKLIESAKFVKQYDDRIKQLSEEAKSALAGKTDKALIEGIAQTYIDAINQVKDARTALIAERNKTEQEQGKTLDHVIINANKLKSIGEQTVESRAFGKNNVPLLQAPGITTPNIDISSLDKIRKKFDETTGYISESAKQFSEDFNNIIATGAFNAFTSFGEALGQAIVTGDNLFEALGQSILGSMGDILVQFGKLTIAAGIASSALATALTKPFLPGSGLAAIAAGVALVAIGSAVKAFSSNLGGGGGGGTSKSSPKSIPQFATGVTGFNGGMALVGEKGPELVTMGRGANVITNDNVNRFMSRGNGDINVVATVGISMGQLVVGIEREKKLMNRTT